MTIEWIDIKKSIPKMLFNSFDRWIENTDITVIDFKSYDAFSEKSISLFD